MKAYIYNVKDAAYLLTKTSHERFIFSKSNTLFEKGEDYEYKKFKELIYSPAADGYFMLYGKERIFMRTKTINKLFNDNIIDFECYNFFKKKGGLPNEISFE